LFYYKHRGQHRIGPEPEYVTQYGEHPIKNNGKKTYMPRIDQRESDIAHDPFFYSTTQPL
jgi:hypothetical protein